MMFLAVAAALAVVAVLFLLPLIALALRSAYLRRMLGATDWPYIVAMAAAGKARQRTCRIEDRQKPEIWEAERRQPASNRGRVRDPYNPPVAMTGAPADGMRRLLRRG